MAPDRFWGREPLPAIHGLRGIRTSLTSRRGSSPEAQRLAATDDEIRRPCDCGGTGWPWRGGPLLRGRFPVQGVEVELDELVQRIPVERVFPRAPGLVLAAQKIQQ